MSKAGAESQVLASLVNELYPLMAQGKIWQMTRREVVPNVPNLFRAPHEVAAEAAAVAAAQAAAEAEATQAQDSDGVGAGRTAKRLFDEM